MRELLRPGRYNARIVASKATRTGLWVVWARDSGETWIECNVIEGRRAGDYAVKSMDEGCGPYYFDCPLAFLDLAPVACAEWRENVRAHHAARVKAQETRAALQVGDLVRLVGRTIPEIRITEIKGRTILGTYGGRLYRLSRAALTHATVTKGGI